MVIIATLKKIITNVARLNLNAYTFTIYIYIVIFLCEYNIYDLVTNTFINNSGGVYTSAVAFGDAPLIENLKKTGKVVFEVLEPGSKDQ